MQKNHTETGRDAAFTGENAAESRGRDGLGEGSGNAWLQNDCVVEAMTAACFWDVWYHVMSRSVRILSTVTHTVSVHYLRDIAGNKIQI